jgi:hypothetical protein
MKKILKYALSFALLFVLAFSLVSCGNMGANQNQVSGDSPAEKVELAKTTLSEVEFENAKSVNLNQESNVITVSGTIDAMSASQKNAFGLEDVTHVVVLKFTFDKERTLSSFEIKGKTTKVYSDSEDVENYVGSLSELLDSESSEDAYTYLILSANTETYDLTAKYTDGTTSKIELKVVATLATATAE